MRCYAGPGDEVLYSRHGFLIYPIGAQSVGATPVAAPERDLTADVDALLERVTPQTRIVFIANPNNPTGTYLSRRSLARLHAGLPSSVVLVIDAAYAEFVKRNDYEAGGKLVDSADNVVMMRTFSKIYALAGLRLGWGYCPPAIADVLNRVRGPFNVSTPAIAAGVAAVEDIESLDRARAHNDLWLPWFSERLAALGLPLTPSVANFVLPRFPDEPGRNAEAAFAFLAVARHPDPQDGRLWAAGTPPDHHRHRRGDGEVAAVLGEFTLGDEIICPVHPRSRLFRESKLFDRVAFIGIGLIGSSLARVLRRDSPGTEIVACARRSETLTAVERLELADRTTHDPAEAANGADLVVIATPLSAYAEIGSRIGAGAKAGRHRHRCRLGQGSRWYAISAHTVPDGVHFVPGHPVAGTEHSGPESGFAELFHDRWCILTPLPETSSEAVAKVGEMWQLAGMRVMTMSAAHHDRVLAMTSHLPHLIAYTIVGTATDLEETLKSEVIAFSASGFRDFTRIAASDPVMWRDIFLNNREAVLDVLQRFSEDLTALQRAIRWGEGDKLQDLFTRTRAIRRSIIEAKQA